ncbi:hypothetical protein BJV74DRAFT_281744 [Russula compacta]|nr:hypothetical protein BJV74DRAFT_281744 [Russula compacta]
MFLFDLFADFTRPFRDTCPQIDDSDDEADVSVSDNASETDVSDILEANSDLSVSSETSTGVHGSGVVSNTDLNSLPTPPSSPYAPPYSHELPMSGGQATQFSERQCVVRRVRPSARHSAYSLPSREQRQAFKMHSRHRKDMFVQGHPLPIGPPVEPTTVLPTADLVLANGRVEVPSKPVNPVETNLSAQFAAQCTVVESQRTPTDTVFTPMATSPNPRRPTKKSGLTIKIPGLVDRLALRLLGSCNVTGQAEEDESVESPSLDGDTASETSSDGDIDDDDHRTFCSSPSLAAPKPNRSSRRELRRRATAPYHRTGGKPKRKELWVAGTPGRRASCQPFCSGRPLHSVLVLEFCVHVIIISLLSPFVLFLFFCFSFFPSDVPSQAPAMLLCARRRLFYSCRKLNSATLHSVCIDGH